VSLLIPSMMGLAIVTAGAAAVSDARSSTIPNWITLPPIILAPLLYAITLGVDYGLQSLASAFVSGTAPYLMFRRQAMGGGDVKLFAALGALAGFDPLAGVQIQLVAFTLAMFLALCIQAWRGRLFATLASAMAVLLNGLLPSRYRLAVSDELRVPIRMGGPILLATVTSSMSHVAGVWSAS
jgi:prepilin peptidase CpaA